MPPSRTYILGLALGQTCDFSALAIVEVPALRRDFGSDDQLALSLRHLRRFSPGTPYPQIARVLRELFREPALAGAALVVDQTGVARTVLNLVWNQLINCVDAILVPVTLSSAHETIYDRGEYILPKKELIGTLQVLLQTRRLQVARELSDAPTLLKELETYRVRVTTAGSDSTDAWREGEHDDLVFAVGLAAWFAEHFIAVASRAEESTVVYSGA